MITFMKSAFAKSFLGGLAGSHDTKTTVLGLVATAILISGVDFGKLMDGDPTEVGKVAGAIVAAAWGYYTNKPPAPPAIPATDSK